MFGFFKKYYVHMCSEVKGTLTNSSKPVQNAVIERSLIFANKVIRNDDTRSAKDGSFYLPEVVIESKIPGDMFSHEVTQQTIIIKFNDVEYVLWSSRLNGIIEPTEYKNKLASLNGDLESKNVNFVFPDNSNLNTEFCASSICRWDTDFEIYEIEDSYDYFKDL